MKHPDEGQLRAWIDRELGEDSAGSIEAHLAACSSCSQKLGELKSRAGWTQSRLEAPKLGVSERAPREAHRRMRLLIERKQMEDRTMWKRLTRRPAMIGLAIVMVLGLSLAFPSVRGFATGLLKIFRVQQVAVVPIDTANLPDAVQANRAQIESLLSDDVKYETQGERKTVTTLDDATSAGGFDVRLPDAGGEKSDMFVQPGVSGSFSIDVERVNQLLKELGQQDLSLSKELDGAVVEFNVPNAVVASYGTCTMKQMDTGDPDIRPQEYSLPSGSDCTVLMQMPSPTVNAPEGLDVSRFGQAFFRMTGMSEADAKALSEKIDWSTTLVVPIPMNSARVTDVQVDGVSATLIQQTEGKARSSYVLIWVNDGILYAVAGKGDSQQGIDLANSLQ